MKKSNFNFLREMRQMLNSGRREMPDAVRRRRETPDVARREMPDDRKREISHTGTRPVTVEIPDTGKGKILNAEKREIPVVGKSEQATVKQ